MCRRSRLHTVLHSNNLTLYASTLRYICQSRYPTLTRPRESRETAVRQVLSRWRGVPPPGVVTFYGGGSMRLLSLVLVRSFVPRPARRFAHTLWYKAGGELRS